MSQKIVQRRLQILEKRLDLDADQEVQDADLEVQDVDQGKDFLEPFVLFLITAKRKLERLQFSTSSSFVKI